MLRELDGSRSGKITIDGEVATALYECDWVEKDYMITLLGRESHPGKPYLMPVDISYEPYGYHKVANPSPGQEYNWCRITVEYASVFNPDDMPSRTFSITPEIANVGEGRTWTTTSTACDQPLTQLIPVQEETLTLSYNYYLPLAQINALVGKINAYAHRGYAARTLIFMGVDSSTSYDFRIQGWKHKVNYKFQHRELDYNLYWDAAQGAWDTTSPLVYTEADFSILGF